jgi:hypothetical protein
LTGRRRRSRLVWIAVTALYALLLLAAALLVVLDAEASAHEKLVYLLVLAGVPALDSSARRFRCGGGRGTAPSSSSAPSWRS